MADAIRSNLEPIGEEDLNLEKKFKEISEENSVNEAEPKNETILEKKPEMVDKVKEKEQSYQTIIAKTKTQSNNDNASDDAVDDEAQVINREKDVETKIQSLVGLAENKGVVYAVKVARHLEDNYMLDELHDRLLGEELHDALLKKGLIQDI